MSNLIKWWKDKNLLLVIVIAVASIMLATTFACLIDWGWIIAIVIAIIGGVSMRCFIVKYIKNKFKNYEEIR